MKDALLFSNLPPKPSSNIRKERAELVRGLKEKHNIFTHNSPGSGDWLALSLAECVEALKGYALTEDEKKDGALLIAGYGRLLDDAGLIEEFHKTEFEAVNALVARMEGAAK